MAKGLIWLYSTVEKDGSPARNKSVLATGRTYDDTYSQLFMPFLTWVEDLQRACDAPLVSEVNRSRMDIVLVNGSYIRFRSGNTPNGLRGWSLDFYLGDEYAFCDPDVFPTVEPALADRQGDAFFASSPNGLNHYYDLFMNSQSNDDLIRKHWASHTTTTLQGGIVKPERIELARRTLSARQFRQEYEASFENIEGLIYTEFTPGHITKEIRLDPRQPLLIGMDFNVGQTSLVFGQTRKDQLWAVKEKEILGYTIDAIQHIRNDFREWTPDRIFVYPDASGNNRQTATKTTDHLLLKQAGFHVMSPKKNPLIIDRVNTVQGLFRSAAGDYRLFVHPDCSKLIRSLRGLVWVNGQRDKGSGLDHMSDALDYMAVGVFPMLQRHITIAKAA
jgi:hypothetical protein